MGPPSFYLQKSAKVHKALADFAFVQIQRSDTKHARLGKPAGVYAYQDMRGCLLGYVCRFIRAVAEAPGYWNERTFSRASMNLLEAIAATSWLWDIEYDAEGRETERTVPVSRQAKALYAQWYNSIVEEAFISDNAALMTKLRGQAQRICLLLHSLDTTLWKRSMFMALSCRVTALSNATSGKQKALRERRALSHREVLSG